MCDGEGTWSVVDVDARLGVDEAVDLACQVLEAARTMRQWLHDELL